MQNQAIDVLIARDGPTPLQQQLKMSLPPNLRESFYDHRGSDPELILGRAAIKDLTNSRVLERLMMYERRLENSMLKTMKELDVRKLIRRMEAGHPQAALEAATQSLRAEAGHPHPDIRHRDEAATPGKTEFEKTNPILQPKNSCTSHPLSKSRKIV